MKIATYNVNGINGRLPVLLQFLDRVQPDIVCLQELKCPDAGFPAQALREAGYDAIWQGQARWNGVALLSRGMDIVETRRGLPGDPNDDQSRYLEAAIGGIIVAGFYVPNGNPRPGPKFAYKLRWLERLHAHAAELKASGLPVAMIGDYNIMPTDLDVHKPERWQEDALFAPEVRRAFADLVAQGWTDSLRTIHPERIYTFWHFWRQAFERDAGLRIDHILLSPDLAARLADAQVERWVRGLDKTSDHAPVWAEIADKPVRAKRRKS